MDKIASQGAADQAKLVVDGQVFAVSTLTMRAPAEFISSAVDSPPTNLMVLPAAVQFVCVERLVVTPATPNDTDMPGGR